MYFGSVQQYTRKKGAFAPYILKKKTFRRNKPLYHVGIHWFLSKMPLSLIKVIDLQLFVFRSKDLTLIYFCDKRFFQKKIHIKSYIYLTKICKFISFNIKLRGNCVELGKFEDTIVLRTQFYSRVC